MGDQQQIDGRILKAANGDHDALAGLLYDRYGKLEKYIARRLPPDAAEHFGSEDIVQEVHIEAFRSIKKFVPKENNSFDRWLITIARQRLLDNLKAFRRKKRAGSRKRVRRQASPNADSQPSLLGLVAAVSRTPSRSAAGREREKAVIVILAALKEDYRQALQLRYVEGLPVADIAQKMNRTERAVHMLCNRGIKAMREQMGSASRYLTRF